MSAVMPREEYKVVVSPTREGWRYVVQVRRVGKGAWKDLPPYRTFTTRDAAGEYVESLEQ